jgi:soluble lytic murein transglycosylase-like protein
MIQKTTRKASRIMPPFLVAIFAAIGALWLSIRREFEAASSVGDISQPAPDPAPLVFNKPAKPTPLDAPASTGGAGSGASGSWAVSSGGGATGAWKAPAGAAPYLNLFNRATTVHSLPIGFLARVAQEESNFDPNALSPEGAAGIMQFMARVAADLGIDPYDPPQAINEAGAEFKRLYRRFGNWRLSLAAYNWGQGNLGAAMADPNRGLGAVPNSVKKYVTRIAGDLGL